VKQRILCVAAAAAALALLSAGSFAEAQAPGTISLTSSATSCVEKCAPTLTWSTSPAAASCSAAWTTSKAASGSQAIAEITSTKAYAIDCTWPGALQTVTVFITPVLENTDNTPLTDLAGFKVRYGTSATALSQSISVPDPKATSQLVSPSSAGTWFFAVRQVTSKGIESDDSTPTQLLIGSTGATASSSVTVTVDKKPKPPGVSVRLAQAFEIVPDYHAFQFNVGRQIGTAKLGAACDESRSLGDGYFAIVQYKAAVTLWPGVPAQKAVAAQCG
jgi:hypothetical protein